MKKSLTTLALLAACFVTNPQNPTFQAEDPSSALGRELPTLPKAASPMPGASPRASLGPAFPAGGSVLSSEAVQKLLTRFAPFPEEKEERTDFSLREGSLPAPRSGAELKESIGAAAIPKEPTAAALTILRRAPEGNVSVVPEVSITFSQPMVALSSVENTKKAPAEITPKVEGEWRWLGTQTAVFVPNEGRFPMSTDIRVTVPEGTQSALGNSFAKSESFSFSTSAPSLVALSPSPQSTLPEKPTFLLSFDQKVTPEAVLASLLLEVSRKPIALRIVTPEETKKSEPLTLQTKNLPEGRWLLVTPKEPLPADSKVKLTLQAKSFSAEGPRATEESLVFYFKTYGPLRLERADCEKEDCSPDRYSLDLAFTNVLDEKAFDPKWVTVDPPMEGQKAIVSGRYLYIQGEKKPETTYKVLVSSSLQDIYGQRLAKNVSASLRIGRYAGYFTFAREGFVILDPDHSTSYPLFSINESALRVRLFRVTPEDWPQYIRFYESRYNWQAEQLAPPPGELLKDVRLRPSYKPDELVETRIDLSAALQDGLGNAFLLVEDTAYHENERERRRTFAWVQSTRLAIDITEDPTELTALVTQLTDGGPVEGASVTLYPSQSRQTTDAKGLATLSLPNGYQPFLVAQKDNDASFLPYSAYSNSSGWQRRLPQDELVWFVFDDRNLYRPGEEVKVKGWLRKRDPREGGDIQFAPGWAKQLSYTLTDSRGNELKKGSVSLGLTGAFDLSFSLPKTVNLGGATLQLSVDTSIKGYQNLTHYHYLRVQEFRKPEYSVSAKVLGAAPFFLDQQPEVSVEALYFAGGALPNAEASWSFTASPTNYTPPNRDDFTFGLFIPWWESEYNPAGGQYLSENGKTDLFGQHTTRLRFTSPKPPRPLQVTAEGTVYDINRQAWSSSTSLLLHPSSLYVGLRSDRYFIEKGEAFLVDAIVTDLDGKAVPKVSTQLTLARLSQEKSKDGVWETKEVDPETCTVTSSATSVQCRFAPTVSGTYRVRAIVSDDKGRQNASELTLWVAGVTSIPAETITQGKVTLIPNQKEYQAGEVAEILVQPPFTPAQGYLTLRRNGLLQTEHFTIEKGKSYLAKVPIQEGYVPNVYVQVDLYGEERITRRTKPAYATGSLSLSVPPHQRRLEVSITPKEKNLAPGGETELTVEVKDASGKEAQAEVAIVVVDEAILTLANYQIPDPLSFFYQLRYPATSDIHSRQYVTITDINDIHFGYDSDADGILDDEDKLPEEDAFMDIDGLPEPEPRDGTLAKLEPPAQGGKGGQAQEATPITIRSDFRALALFAASVITDAKGKAVVPLKLPDNVTRYRMMAVAVKGEKQFGKGESSLTAKMPLMVRPSAPRFLRFGDTLELPVVVQNQTDQALETDVLVRATNSSLEKGMGYRVKIPANDRIEVRFPLETKLPGKIKIQVGAISGKLEDAAALSLPVYTPATTEAFATYGTIENGAIVQPVEVPSGVFSGFGGIEVTTSSTALSELTDAFLYLQNYPYECAEQISSRVLAVVALQDTLAAFGAKELPSPEAIKASVQKDLKRLEGMQNYDGGVGFWRRGDQSWPFLSVHVAHTFARAKAKGFSVSEEAISSSLQYLEDIDSRYPKWYSEETKLSLSSYALYVRVLLGDFDKKALTKLLKRQEALPLEAQGWVLAVLQEDKTSFSKELAALRQSIMSRVTETAGEAHFVTSYGDQDYVLLHSDRRADGVLLEALLLDDPSSDLLPKLVRGLLSHRVKGRWSTTQENAFVLLALDKYFKVFEGTPPDFIARAWLGDTYAGGNAFKGRSAERHFIKIPMEELQQGAKELLLSKEGAGRLYYRLVMSYAPTDLKLSSLDRGFTVIRSYEPVEYEKDVYQDEKGVWHLKAGARVRVKLTMIAPARRYHVALVDSLPSGLEIQNPELSSTQSIPQDPGAINSYDWWFSSWFEHQNLRDERAEAFSSLLWDGVYQYSYVARATTPGLFVVPPAKAEEMYSPEVFGRSASDQVVIE